MKRRVIVQGAPRGGVTLLSRIERLGADRTIDGLDAAMAYVTLSGVDALFNALGRLPASSRWVIGLDDAVTQPAAIERLWNLPGAEVTVVALASEGRRFHPKVLRFRSSTDMGKAILVVGSGNLTAHGLSENGEAAVLLRAENAADAATFDAVWAPLWTLGEPLTPTRLADYRDRYKAVRRLQRKLAGLGANPPEPDELADPATEAGDAPLAAATTCWIDIGNGMSNGKELEFKRSLVPFFNIDPADHTSRQRRYTDRNNLTTTSPFVYRGTANQMWRTTVRSEVAGADRLRTRAPDGTLRRSDFAAVFTKTDELDRFGIEFVKLNSAAYRMLIRRSRVAGSLNRTQAGKAGRNFGFF